MHTIPPEAGFLGLPVETDLARITAQAAILGVPHGWAYPRPGTTAACAAAPGVVRQASQRLASFVGHWDFDFDGPVNLGSAVDAGDVPGEPADGPGNSSRISAAVRAILDAGAIPICLGGDDSVPIPILRAHEGRGPITVLQFDAHLDYRDEVDGVREGYSSPMRRASEMPHVERIVHVGLRGVGSARPSDVDDSRAAGNLLITARELRERGVPWLLDQVPSDASVFLSFDYDGLDPSVFAPVSAFAPGGVSYPDAVDLLLGIGPRLIGAAFTEFAPTVDTHARWALTACRLTSLLVQQVTSRKS